MTRISLVTGGRMSDEDYAVQRDAALHDAREAYDRYKLYDDPLWGTLYLQHVTLARHFNWYAIEQRRPALRVQRLRRMIHAHH